LDFDTIVIGGGLAGGAAAMGLAVGGQRVAVIERTPNARHKVCGDFISNDAVGLLTDFGLKPDVLGATRIENLRLISGYRVATSPLPIPGAGISRMRLDQALLDLAARAGAEVIRGEAAGAIDYRPKEVAVMVGATRLTARSAVLATGKHSLRGYQRPRRNLTGFKLLFRANEQALQKLSATVQLAVFGGGYIGAVVVEDRGVSMAWLVRNELLPSLGTAWHQHRDFLTKRAPILPEFLVGLEPRMQKPLAVSGLPLGYLRHRAVADNLYAVGDQLAVIPSLAGDGAAIALASGKKAAEAILGATTARSFQREFTKGLRWQFRFAGLGQAAFENPIARLLGIRLAAAAPSIVRSAVRATRLRVR